MPGGGERVDLIQKDQASWKVLCCLEHVCQRSLALAIPLGHDGFQRDVNQGHRGLAGNHPAAELWLSALD